MSDSSLTSASQNEHTDVACPFCGLVCDDLVIKTDGMSVQPVTGACAKALAGYAAASVSGVPTADGAEITLDQAVQRAARLLKASRQPLFAGLGVDVAGARAAFALAERCGAIVDHMHSAGIQQNLRVLQTTGWQTTTFSEVRNRADLIVLVGVDVNRNFQNFIPRVLAPANALQAARRSARQLVFMGPKAMTPIDCAGLPLTTISCKSNELAANMRALQKLFSDKTNTKGRLPALASALRAASYPVFVWSPGDFDATTGDITIAAICAVLADLNKTQRAAGLALGGDEGGQTALGVCTWLTGFPLGVSFAGASIDYAPQTYSTAAVLDNGSADCLLWVNSFTRHAPPSTSLPRIILAPPGLEVSRANTTYIPVGTPGIDHAGQLMRGDGVVSLPLRPLRSSGLPSAAAILQQIAAALER